MWNVEAYEKLRNFSKIGRNRAGFRANLVKSIQQPLLVSGPLPIYPNRLNPIQTGLFANLKRLGMGGFLAPPPNLAI